jgi:hypothetical protein
MSVVALVPGVGPVLPGELESLEEKLARLRIRFTPQQLLFCDSYLDSGDCLDAYFRAYGRHNRARAYALLDTWYARDYIAAVLETDNSDAHIVTRTEVLESLHREMTGGEKSGDRVKAAEVLLRECGHNAGAAGSVVNIQVNNSSGLTATRIKELRTKILGIPDIESDDI